MTFKKHVFHKWKNELKKLLVKLPRSWTAHLYINIAQTLPAKPGGRADRGSMFSFLYKTCTKAGSHGECLLQDTMNRSFLCLSKFFLQYYIAFDASPDHQQWVRSQHWYLPLQGAGMGGKAQPGKQSCAHGKQAAGGESRLPAFAAETVILSRHVSPKQVGKRRGKVQVMGFGEVKNEQYGNMQCLTCGFVMPACEAGGFSHRSGDWEHSGCNVTPTSHDKCQLC